MKTVLLRSGYAMPMIGFGTWTLRGEACAEAVKTALLTGYRLIDTAQMYRNEDAVSEGIRRAGIPGRNSFSLQRCALPPTAMKGQKNRSGDRSPVSARTISISSSSMSPTGPLPPCGAP